MSPFRNGNERKLWLALIISWILIFLILLGSVAYTSAKLIGVQEKMRGIDPTTLAKIKEDLAYIKSHQVQTGKDGQNGTNGSDGLNGADGSNGKDGVNAVSTYVEKENTIIQQTPLTGIQGLTGAPGVDGKTVEIGRTEDGQIVWRIAGDREWQQPAVADINYDDLASN